MTRDPALVTRTRCVFEGPCTLHSDTTSGYTLGHHFWIHTRTPSSGSVRLSRVCQHFAMLGYSASLSPDSQASDPSSRLVFTEGRTLVKFMIRAPDPRPPLATPTVLLLPHKLQLFTSRSFVHCFLKISLQPFRYYTKASRSFKFTPFRFQITVPISSQSLDPHKPNSHKSRPTTL